MVSARPKAKTDESARIGNGLALPAVVRLILAHGFFAGLVPAATSLIIAQVVLANQSLLNLLSSTRINLLLASGAG